MDMNRSDWHRRWQGAEVIGIAGVARSGKTTVARIATERYGFTNYAFAEPVKRALIAMFQCDPDLFEDQRKKSTAMCNMVENLHSPLWGATPRRLMQTLGTDWGRDIISKELWIALADKARLNCVGPLLVTDVRFENEANWVRQHGRLVHVTRHEESNDHHPSENGVKLRGGLGDVLLVNDGTLEDLLDDTIRLFETLNYLKGNTHHG